MMRAETNQYFFIFGAIVVVLFLFAAYTSLAELFDFTEPKRIVTIDSLEVLLESMDAQAGYYLSGYVTAEEAVVFEETDTKRILRFREHGDGPVRQLILRENTRASDLVLEGTARIEANVDSAAIAYRAIGEPACEAEPLSLDDVIDRPDIDVDARREGSLDDPRTLVALAQTPQDYCRIAGLARSYPLQAFITDKTARFTDTGVFLVVI